MTLKLELALLLQERTLSSWERRKRRLERIPPDVAAAGMIKARKGEPLTLEEYIGANLGFLPGDTITVAERMRVARKRMGESGQ